MVKWLKETAAAPLRGFENDTKAVPVDQRRTAARMVTKLELLLGQIVPLLLPHDFPEHYCQKLNILKHHMAGYIRSHVGF